MSLWIVFAFQLGVLAVIVSAAVWLRVQLSRFESRCQEISLANLQCLSDVLDHILLQADALGDSLREPESAVQDYVRGFEAVAAGRRAAGEPGWTWLNVLAEAEHPGQAHDDDSTDLQVHRGAR
jgi:hypothetical protein